MNKEIMKSCLSIVQFVQVRSIENMTKINMEELYIDLRLFFTGVTFFKVLTIIVLRNVFKEV